MPTLDELTYASTPDEVVEATVAECQARGYSKAETVGVIADQRQESGSQMVWSPNRLWFGYFQQDTSYKDRQSPAGNVRGFLDRLDVKRTSPQHGDIWMNIFWLQQGPNWPSAQFAIDHGRTGYLTEIKSKAAIATELVNRYWDDGSAPTPAVVPVTTGGISVPALLKDPRTVTDLNNNCYAPRNMLSPMWIGCHTSESKSRVRDLNRFCKDAGVAYNSLVDDRDILVAVEMANAPWSAMGANKYAYHVCWSCSFAAWSRGQWLDPNTADDGFDERKALRNGALQIAYWIQQSEVRDHRPIPAVWMGDGTVPPWGRNGICGHVDFGQWGGGHHDPGVNFPRDILIADVRAILAGTAGEAPPVVVLPPIVQPGTNPDKYSDWMEYQGKIAPNVDRVKAIQSRLQRAYASYGGHLTVDGDFGPLTKMAVQEFQRRSGIYPDGIVGPVTAAALKP